ncbi:MAG: SPFH domain-containing protein, partial [Bacteroidota bacterium]|nr:SPFH domain-containing protein [Bacteroidota bacterium]
MLWFKFIKFDSKTYVFHYKKGRIVNEGVGLAFRASKRKSSIEAITLGSRDIPFIFSESTSDFQTVSVQGQITYMIEDPKKIAEVLDFTVDLDGIEKTDDDQKLEQRLVNEAQTASTSFIQGIDLRSTITSAQTIQEKISKGLSSSDTVISLGIKIMSVNIIAVKPTPEMEKALETTTREKLQQEADQAIFDRRNFAVEQERIIK